MSRRGQEIPCEGNEWPPYDYIRSLKVLLELQSQVRVKKVVRGVQEPLVFLYDMARCRHCRVSHGSVPSFRILR